jgi:hypothetical protein
MFVKVKNGVASAYPYSLTDLMLEHPQVSFPDPAPDALLAEYGVFPVDILPTPPVEDETHEVVYHDMPQEAGGVWSLGFDVMEKPALIVSENIRRKRDDFLRQTDWIVVKCVETGSQVPADWVAYRQALRDITGQAGFPFIVVWPPFPSNALKS